MIPSSPQAIDAGWLSGALQARVPGVTVSRVDVERVVDATNANATMSVVHDAPDRLPNRLFVKMAPVDPDRRARLDWASMADRETRFYRDLTVPLSIAVPDVYAAELDDDTGEFALVMEVLGTGRTRMPDLVGGLDPALLGATMGEFADLHARYENLATRESEVPWLTRSGRTSDYGARLLRAGIDGGAALAPPFVAVAERYIRDRDLLQDAWELGPATVLHGDGHIGNVFVDERVTPPRIGFFDWGLMTIGSPMRDISYLLAMTLSPADRRANERRLINEYLEARRRHGAAPIAGDDAWFWHRLQSAYTVVASCQSIVPRPDESPGRSAFAAAFVRRAEEAVADLGALDAIDEFARR